MFTLLLFVKYSVFPPLYITENSSPPSFTEPAYNFSVVENNATAFVGQVAAIDSDGDDITFYLTGFGSPKLVPSLASIN